MEDFLNSKYSLVCGGLLFFSLSFIIGLWAGNDVSTAFGHASVASVVGAYLGKVFNAVLILNIKDAIRERNQSSKKKGDS